LPFNDLFDLEGDIPLFSASSYNRMDLQLGYFLKVLELNSLLRVSYLVDKGFEANLFCEEFLFTLFLSCWLPIDSLDFLFMLPPTAPSPVRLSLTTFGWLPWWWWVWSLF
jgi:hypothetical protein